MTSQYFLSFMLLITHNTLLNCASAAVHSHVDNLERENDGSFRPRDANHYGDSGHNTEFDHEAILGSVKDAEEYDNLSPEEAKERLAQLLPQMDLDQNKVIDRAELKEWILNSFIKLSREEATERLAEADQDSDGAVSWSEYLQDSFGAETEEEVSEETMADSGILLKEEKLMWAVADQNGDNYLDIDEFEVFVNPEEHAVMHPLLLQQTLREKDKNGDGVIDFEEYLDHDKKQYGTSEREWILSEKKKFELEADHNKDGVLDETEIKAWVIPNNDEIADEEVDHLFESADDDRNKQLSYEEVLNHHDVFVGSEATNFGNDLLGEHFDDEL